MRSELQPILVQAQSLDPAELPRLIGELKEIRSIAFAHLIAALINPPVVIAAMDRQPT